MDSITDNIFPEEIGVEIEGSGPDGFNAELNKKKEERTQPKTDIKCSICSTNFTHNDHYKIHLGTKKHKRNQRSLRKEVFNIGTPQLQTADNFEDKCYYKGVREKYRQRNIKNFDSNYISYIRSVTAYWAAALTVNPTVNDFKISLNDRKWGDFGDAVIEIEFVDFPGKPSVTKIYAIQFKHIVSNNFRNIDSLSEGSFSCKSVIAKLAQIKDRQGWEQVKFVVFTTAAMSPSLNTYNPVNIAFCSACFNPKQLCICDIDKARESDVCEIPVYIKPLSTRRKDIIDTSDDTQAIYCIFSSDSKFVFPNIYFHTTQKRPRHFPAAIDDLFFELLNERREQVSRELIKYVEKWSDGKCGGTFKLKKEDVLVKLGHSLLSQFIVTPKVKPTDTQNTFEVWLRAINVAHVTVLKDLVNLSEMCEPINRVIERELKLRIDITTETVKFPRSNGRDDVSNVENPVLKYYISEESPGNDSGAIPLETVYLMFWKAGLIPMILQVDDEKRREHVLQVINFLTGLGLNRRYFLKTCDAGIKTVKKGFKNLRFFVVLDDVAEKLPPSLLDQVKINVTDEFSLSLGIIRESDMFFQKSLSANEFFDMAIGKYIFKPFSNSFAKGKGEELKLILSDDRMRSLRKEVESKIDFRNVFRTEYIPQSSRLRGLDPKIFT